MDLTIDRILGIVGIVLALVLVVLDKAGKLKGPVLLVLLAVAALMTLPLALGNSWVRSTPWGMLKFSKGMLMLSLVLICYSVLAIWISPEGHEENPTEDKAGGTKEPRAGAPLVAMRQYGAGPDRIWAKFSCENISAYRDDYVVLLASRVTDPMVDLQKDTDIVKSEPFAIPANGELEIQMGTPKHFIKKSAQINSGLLSVDFMVLMAPKNADLSKVTSMEKIHDIGGLELAAQGVQRVDISELLKKHAPHEQAESVPDLVLDDEVQMNGESGTPGPKPHQLLYVVNAEFSIRNRGSATARSIRVQMGAAPLENPHLFERSVNTTLANELAPSARFTQRFTIRDIEDISDGHEVPKDFVPQAGIVLRLTYRGSGTQIHSKEFYLYCCRDRLARHMPVEDKSGLEPIVRKVFE